MTINETQLTREQAIEVLGSGWRLQRFCCTNAKLRHCVCRISVACPTHGLICVGTHD
jgi:hypothetical protein